MRSHIPIQPARPKTKIIKRITVTEITQPLAIPLPPFPKQEIASNIQTNQYASTLLQPTPSNQTLQLVAPKNQLSLTQQQIQPDNSAVFNRNLHKASITMNNRSVNNISASRSTSKRNKIFGKFNQRFTQSRITHDHNLVNSRRMEANQSFSHSQYQTHKPLETTRVGNSNFNSRRIQSQANQNLKIIPIEVFSYPNRLPEVCCKVKHSRY